LHFLPQRLDLADLLALAFDLFTPKIGSLTVATTLPTKLVIDAIILSLLLPDTGVLGVIING
jgi:hypothetical protein